MRASEALTSSVSRVSVTIVRCALVWPVSTSAQRPRSSSTTERRPGEQIRRRETGDAATDHDDLGFVSRSILANDGSEAESVQYGT